MDGEKIGVLVVTGVVAVLLALTLVRSRPEPDLAEQSVRAEQVEEPAHRPPPKRFLKLREPEKPKPRPQPTRNFHVVRSGERLETIARACYGKRSLWKRIYEANRDQLRSPHRIREGMRLRIP